MFRLMWQSNIFNYCTKVTKSLYKSQCKTQIWRRLQIILQHQIFKLPIFNKQLKKHECI